MITLTGSSRSQDYQVYLDVEERRRLSGLRMLSGSIFRLSTTIPTFRQASLKGKRVFHFHFFNRLKRRGVRKNQSYSFRRISSDLDSNTICPYLLSESDFKSSQKESPACRKIQSNTLA